jgi:hypothetical protein
MDNELKQIISSACTLAAKYYKLTGKPLGITGEVAEMIAAELLNLELVKAREAGYDAVDKAGNKIQIKGRVLQNKNYRGRTGKINIEKEWDKIILVLLSPDYKPLVIFEAEREAVLKRLLSPGSKSHNERWTLSIFSFTKRETFTSSLSIIIKPSFIP